MPEAERISLNRRRSVIALLAAAALSVTGLAPAALAQGYPTRPVRLVVPFAPGGTVDVFARIAAEKLSQRLGQNFYVENVAGASGNIATGQVAKATPDGYTLLLAFSTLVINPSLFATVPYDAQKDFEPITLAVSSTHVITVNPTVPAKTMKELVDVIRANPGKYNFAHGGAGTPAHLLGEQLRTSLKLDLVAVPFNGAGPAVTSVLGGHTPIGFTTITSASSQIAGGQLRAIAVTSKFRSKQLPEVPTTVESGFPDIVGDIWIGALAPQRTPKDIVALLQREFAAVIADPDTQERLAKVGFEPVASTPEAFRQQIETELGVWRQVIQASNLKQN